MAWDVAKGLFVIGGFFLMAFTIGLFVGVAVSEDRMWREATKRGYAELVTTSQGAGYVWKGNGDDKP